MLLGRAFVFAAFVLHPPHTKEYTLPASATIIVGERYHLPAEHPDDKEICDTYSLTAVKVRRMFRTYHKVTSAEMHNYYSFAGCGVKGTVTVRGTSFEWHSEPFHTMQTNYPDGNWKLLGGEYSSDPSAGN